LLLPQSLQAVFYGAAGRLYPAWRPCNVGKLGQDNEDYYYYYHFSGPVLEIIPFLLGTEKGAARLAAWLTEARYFEDICPHHPLPSIN
jgi:hypothetical protein